jgi:tryptophanyl-tRNA synthetase
MDRTLSLITPTGRLTLGNLLGALCGMVAAQDTADCFFGVSDLHALTTPQDPSTLRASIVEVSTLFLAAGLDPARATLFRQSQVPAHRELAYLLECTAYTGELNRMIQFKQKGRGVASTRASLYTYPVLMAADILLYRPSSVPVGDDQRQHVELTRDLAIRFNAAYGHVFVVPEVTVPRAGARVMDLQSPGSKMSKSSGADGGVIRLLDPPDVVRRKVARAVTDSDTGADAVRTDPAKPGVTNLLDILSACGGSADGITTYGALKRAVTEAVVAVLEPLQKAHAELAADPAYVASVFADGSARCRDVTAPVVSDATAAMGLGGR